MEEKLAVPYHRKTTLDIFDEACFYCPLSYETPPRDCIWEPSKRVKSKQYCKYQLEYARQIKNEKAE